MRFSGHARGQQHPGGDLSHRARRRTDGRPGDPVWRGRFLQKPVAAGALTAAIEKGYAHSARLTQTNELRLRYATLTPKEKEVAHWVAAGLMNKDIALKMHIALRTVEVHRARVMEKMDAKSMAELVLQINRSGA